MERIEIVLYGRDGVICLQREATDCFQKNLVTALTQLAKTSWKGASELARFLQRLPLDWERTASKALQKVVSSYEKKKVRTCAWTKAT